MTADALHSTQCETARHPLDCGLHCILRVNGSQPTLQQQLRDDYHWSVTEPSECSFGDGRIERRTIRVSLELDLDFPWLAFLGVRFVVRLKREAIDKKTGKLRSTHIV